jgi:hypothetical protein
MFDYLFRQLLTRVVAHVLLQDPAQQVAVLRNCEVDREQERIAKGTLVKRRPCSSCVFTMLAERIARRRAVERAV